MLQVKFNDEGNVLALHLLGILKREISFTACGVVGCVLTQWSSDFSAHHNHLGNLLKDSSLDPNPRFCSSGQSPIIHILNKFSSEAVAAGLGTTFGKLSCI